MLLQVLSQGLLLDQGNPVAQHLQTGGLEEAEYGGKESARGVPWKPQKEKEAGPRGEEGGGNQAGRRFSFWHTEPKRLSGCPESPGPVPGAGNPAPAGLEPHVGSAGSPKGQRETRREAGGSVAERSWTREEGRKM